jgi:hypothetical protein
MILGLCIGVLDEKIGPTAVYHLNLTEELSKKLTMKVMIGVMSFSSETNENDLRGESIIPLSKEKIIAFAYLFTIKDEDARGGFRQSSLILAFDLDDRFTVYKNATFLARALKSFSQAIKLEHIQSKKFPMEISERYDRLQSELYEENKIKASKGKSNIEIVCPICTKRKNIEIPNVVKGVNFIEHQLLEGEVCEHSFTVYLDSKFNILGYKDPEIEITDMKNMFSKLKSPYD